MRISDWSSDVCSSDLHEQPDFFIRRAADRREFDPGEMASIAFAHLHAPAIDIVGPVSDARQIEDRKSGVSGKSVSVRADLGGRRIITKKTTLMKHDTLESLLQHQYNTQITQTT